MQLDRFKSLAKERYALATSTVNRTFWIAFTVIALAVAVWSLFKLSLSLDALYSGLPAISFAAAFVTGQIHLPRVSPWLSRETVAILMLQNLLAALVMYAPGWARRRESRT